MNVQSIGNGCINGLTSDSAGRSEGCSLNGFDGVTSVLISTIVGGARELATRVEACNIETWEVPTAKAAEFKRESWGVCQRQRQWKLSEEVCYPWWRERRTCWPPVICHQGSYVFHVIWIWGSLLSLHNLHSLIVMGHIVFSFPPHINGICAICMSPWVKCIPNC